MLEEYDPYKFDGKCEYGNGFYSGYCKCRSHRRDRHYYSNNSSVPPPPLRSSISFDSLLEYSLLGIEPPVTATELRKAYHKKALYFHPDKTNGDSEMFLKIKDAYDTISSSL